MVTTLKNAEFKQNWMDKAFLRSYRKSLLKELSNLPNLNWSEISQSIAQKAYAYMTQYTDLLTDQASYSHLIMTSQILSSYQVIKSVVPDEKAAYQVVKNAYINTGKNISKGLMDLMGLLIKDPFSFMVNISKKKQTAYYGSSFVREHVRDDKMVYEMIITKCFYHSFFLNNGAPELTAIFCEKDNNWSDIIDPKKLGFCFERPKTLGYGGDSCVFRFKRVDTLNKQEQTQT